MSTHRVPVRQLPEMYGFFPLEALPCRQRYTFAAIVRTLHLCALLRGWPPQTANAIEAAMGWVKKRADGAGTENRGVIAPAFSGKKLLSGDRLRELQKHYPVIAKAPRLPLWRLLAGEELFFLANPEYQIHLSDEVYWLINEPVLPWVRVRRLVWEPNVEDLVEERLLRLCFLGSLEGATALWLLLLEALRMKQNVALAMRIGAYLPPALALYAATSPACERVAVLVFSRLRQLVLDNVRTDAQAFALENYDLHYAANEARDWWAPTGQDATSWRKRELTPIVLLPQQTTWIGRWRGPWVTRTRPLPKAVTVRWAQRLRPLHALKRHPANLPLLSNRAKAEFRRTLSDYW